MRARQWFVAFLLGAGSAAAAVALALAVLPHVSSERPLQASFVSAYVLVWWFAVLVVGAIVWAMLGAWFSPVRRLYRWLGILPPYV